LVLLGVGNDPPDSHLVRLLTEVDVPGANVVIFNMRPHTTIIRSIPYLQCPSSLEDDFWAVDSTHPPSAAEDVAGELEESGETLFKILHCQSSWRPTLSTG
jgi:hypothetical protein